MPDTEDEFVLLVARREGRGRLAVVAPVADHRLTEQAIRKCGGSLAVVTPIADAKLTRQAIRKSAA